MKYRKRKKNYNDKKINYLKLVKKCKLLKLGKGLNKNTRKEN